MVGDLAADDPGLGEHLCEGHLSQAPPPKAPVGSPEPVEPWSDEEEGGLVLDYEQLENLLSRGCVRPEHESAGKKAVWVRSLGLGDMRGEEECTLMYQVLQKSNVRLTIWHMFQLPLEVKLLVEIVSPPVRTRISSYKLYPLILISYHSYYNWSRRVSRIGRTTRIQW